MIDNCKYPYEITKEHFFAQFALFFVGGGGLPLKTLYSNQACMCGISFPMHLSKQWQHMTPIYFERN